MEEDVPSQHQSGKLPVLDLQVWVEEVEGVPQVMFEFYKKPMKSDTLLLARSAISNSTKRSTLFSEGMRRLLNCSPELPWETKAKHLSKFSYGLLISGYSHRYRLDLINGVL